MGSLVLGVGGAALGNFLLPGLGGFIGAAIGSAAGGLVDNLLFGGGGAANQYSMHDGPRLGDLSVMSSAYGQPIPVAYGPQNRVAGNVIWSTGLIEDAHQDTQTSGSGGGGKGGMGGGGGSQTVQNNTYTYRVTFAVGLAAGFCWGIKRIFANKKVIFDRTLAAIPIDAPTPSLGMACWAAHGTHTAFQQVDFYQGNDTQMVDPIIESIMGAGNAPAYRHTCYMVIQNLQLADFGNVLPQIEVELIAQQSITVAAVAADLCARAGVTNVSASGLDMPIQGYVIARDSNVISALAPMALAFNFDAAEQRGQVRLIHRGGALKAVVETDDMGAVNAGNTPAAEPMQLSRLADVVLPREVVVSFADPAFDFQQSSQRVSRTKGSSSASLSQALPITMDATAARTVAARSLFEAWAARRTASFPTSDKWISLSPADIIGLQLAGGIVPFKLTRAMRGADGIIEVEARFEDTELYSSPAAGAEANLPVNVYVPPGPTRLVMIDSPIVVDASDTAGFYWSALGVSPSWRGAQLERSIDAGATYGLMSGVATRGVIGDVAAALPDGPTDYFDEGNEIVVVLAYPRHTLEGILAPLVLAGGNLAWLGPANGQGGEILQFRDAELVAPATWRLTGLLRGRRGTEYATATHGAAETFVLLTWSTVGRSNYGAADWNFPRLYKPVSNLTLEVDAVAQSFTNTGEGLRPFSPVHVAGTRNDASDLTITWVRRTRLSTPTLGGGPVPLGEASERYEVDILVGFLVVRTIAATTPTAAYSAAQQTTDGLTPGALVHVAVYQMSDVRGRGHPARATI